MDGPFTFETLSSKEAEEKKSRSLTKIEASFFRYVANYLEQLESAYRKEQEMNASSKRGAFLVDELRNATNKGEELWKTREKKIVQLAQVNARKEPPPPPPENLTREESALYQNLMTLLREQWQRLLPQRSTVQTGHPPAVRAQTPAPAATAAPLVTPAQATPSVTPPPSVAESPDEVQTIRALVDIPPFIGYGGKTYRIRKGEVLSLPKPLAAILKDRNQASIVA